MVFLLGARTWQLVTGPLTLVLVTGCLTAELQGFYFTFGSLIALQSFVELGFTVVIINLASHEWAGLELDAAGRITGDPDALSRLVSLGRLIFKWYAAAAAIFLLGAGSTGYFLFSARAGPAVDWRGPWLSLVVLAALQFWTLPFVALLEGCNQLRAVNSFRLRQAVVGNLLLWTSLALGAGLWAPVVYTASNTAVALALLLWHHHQFFVPFRRARNEVRIHWKNEIWPMQWRLALSGIVNYWALSLYNPVMFYYHGAQVAGQMGLTLSVVNAIQAVALSWIYIRIPRFGVLVAKSQYQLLDAEWRRTVLISFTVCLLGSAAAWLAIYAVTANGLNIAHRLLPLAPASFLLIGVNLLHFVQCEAAYLRAHRKEPIVAMSVTTSLVTGFLVWWWGSSRGPIGATAGYATVSVVALIWATIVWSRCRREWHVAVDPAQSAMETVTRGLE